MAGTPSTVTASAPTAPFSELSARHLGPVRRYFVRHRVAMDLVVMAVYFVPSVVGIVAIGPAPESGPSVPTWVYLALVTAGTMALFFRRRAPLVTAGVILALFSASVLLTRETLGFDLALALTMYAVAASRPTWVSWTALGAILLVTAAAVAISGIDVVQVTRENGSPLEVDQRVSTLIGNAILVIVALAIGISVRNRRQHLADLVERANALARDRDRMTELARAAERSRIAREMHDVVAHSLSVMITLADGAAVAMDRSPDRTRLALTELSSTGRAALGDMRRVLGALQDTEIPLEPQPGGPELTELVERFRTAGLPVRTEGLDLELPADTGLRLAVYRVVQEALTNVLRHAPGTPRADVAVRRADQGWEVEVVDQGPAVPVHDAGGARQGLIGMRERAAILGGTVEAGPWGHGWRVRVVIPTQEVDR
jgi:signal transduction histidine kinase